MLEAIQGGLATEIEVRFCSAEYCRRTNLDADGLCGFHNKMPNDETMRLLSMRQKFQLMSIPFNGWLPLYPNDIPSGSQWESMMGPVIFSRDALTFLEDVGLVAYELLVLHDYETTPVFSLTQRGQWVVEDLRTVGLSRSKCFDSLHGNSRDYSIGQFQGAA